MTATTVRRIVMPAGSSLSSPPPPRLNAAYPYYLQSSTTTPPNIRPANNSDIAGLTEILFRASSLDPNYPYRFPDRNDHPGEYYNLCREKVLQYCATDTVVVYEMPSNTDPSVWEVVAFSVWAMPSPPPGAASHETYRSPIGEPRPRNTLPMMRPITFGNCAREEAFKSACAANKDRFFDGPYNKRHVFLKILLCHPDYQRRGAGTALTNWGIDAARRLGVNTTVFASPMGESLYEKLGFKKLGTFRVQSDGDAAFLEIPAMVLATATQRVQ